MVGDEHHTSAGGHTDQGHHKQRQMCAPALVAILVAMQVRAQSQPRITVAVPHEQATATQLRLTRVAPAPDQQPQRNADPSERWVVRAERDDAECKQRNTGDDRQ